MNRSPLRLFVLAMTAVVAVLVLPGSAQAAPYCGITWGSLAKAHDAGDREMVNDVRAGRHACFDRLVIDLGGEDVSFGSYDVRYVPLVHEDGSGFAVPVRGAADLQIILRAPAYNENGPTFDPPNDDEVVNVAGFTTFRQVAWAGTFEGQTTLALGVRARLPFRVLLLDGTPQSDHGPRLVVDVAHRW